MERCRTTPCSSGCSAVASAVRPMRWWVSAWTGWSSATRPQSTAAASHGIRWCKQPGRHGSPTRHAVAGERHRTRPSPIDIRSRSTTCRVRVPLASGASAWLIRAARPVSMHGATRASRRAAPSNARRGDAIAWIVLAESELDAGDARAGEAAARRALTLRPGHPEALARLGRAQWMQDRHSEAVASLRAAAAQCAARIPASRCGWATYWKTSAKPKRRAEAYARAHALAPQEPQIAAYLLAWRRKLCDWRDLDALSAQVRDAVRQRQAAVEPFAFLSEDATAAEQLQCARCAPRSSPHGIRPLPPRRRRSARRTLRAGFLSNGFGAHPTGLLTVALFEALRGHGRTRRASVRTQRDDGSAIRQRLQAADHAARRRRTAARAGRRRIRDAGIDVLFDLRGWGGGGAPGSAGDAAGAGAGELAGVSGHVGRAVDRLRAGRWLRAAAMRCAAFQRNASRACRAASSPPTPRARSRRRHRARECGLPGRRGVCLLLLQQQLQAQSRAAWRARWRCCARCPAACCGCCPVRVAPTSACARLRAAAGRRPAAAGVHAQAAARRIHGAPAASPTCSSTPSPTTPTPPPPMRCGPAARC